jgi:exodeoxyribonuclease VII large subunit
MLARDNERPILTVSELTGAVRFTLEERFPLVWVEGEISNLRAPASGHWYFTLKDDGAQVRCAMFTNRNRFVRFKPRDGMQVILRGRVSVYEQRGDFQLLADHLEPAGEGALRAAFETLRAKLGAQGLFDVERKKPLPAFPTHVAVISSRSGAAVRDIVSVFRRRCPTLAITLVDVAVQGKEAELQILDAFERLTFWQMSLGPQPDVVLLARGGGSLEDLWTFNLESVAHAIADCPIPVVSAIGHETDFTIADYIADVRAATPSAGAELIAPDMLDWQRRAARFNRSLVAHWRHTLANRRHRLDLVSRRLTHPGRALEQRMQRLDDIERRLARAALARVDRAVRSLASLGARFAQQHPRVRIERTGADVARLRRALVRAHRVRIDRAEAKLASASRALNAVSPLETLGRGYAIVAAPAPSGDRWGAPITSIDGVRLGDRVVAHLDDGALHCRVEDVEPNAR